MRKKKNRSRANTKPAAPAAAAEEIAVVAPAEEPVATPVAEETATAAVEPVTVSEPPVVEPEKKPVRRTRKPKAEAAAEKAPRRKRKAKEEPAKEKPVIAPLRRSKVDIPDALGLYVQYQGGEINMANIAKVAKAEFKAVTKKSRISSLKIYLKPEEYVAYYVINDDFQGQVAI